MIASSWDYLIVTASNETQARSYEHKLALRQELGLLPYVREVIVVPGAGGGGFLLMVCKSAEDARKVRVMLDTEPANERARFFNYDINQEGLVVTVC